jgi:large subunit ribosomal protein L4
MNIDVLKKDGTKSGETVELKADIFEIEPNDHAIYQAARSYWANQRQGTHKVKSPMKCAAAERNRSVRKKQGVRVRGQADHH